VSRLYDAEVRKTGLRVTQHALLSLLQESGELRHRDLGELTNLEETTLTCNLRPLVKAGWVSVRPGEDRREKLITINVVGMATLKQAHPAWSHAQDLMRRSLPDGV
jgi:DNA-binding MarR family transcriptional regulator